MPYNGVGAFQSLGAPTFPAVSNTPILASYFNATLNDVFAGLSNVLTRDAQAAMTANLPMGGFKVANAADGVDPGDLVTFRQVYTAPTFTDLVMLGIPTAPTAAVGTNSDQVATMAALLNQAFLTALPLISTDTFGSGITNNGTVASWDDSAAEASANLNAWFNFF